MADIFDQINPDKKGDIFDQINPVDNSSTDISGLSDSTYERMGKKRDKPLWQSAVQTISGGHINYDKMPEPEVKFTPEGKMIKVVPESAGTSIFDDPMTYVVPVLRAPAVAVKFGGPIVRKIVGKTIGMGKEAIGQATGGVSDIAELVTKKAVKTATNKIKTTDIFDKINPEKPAIRVEPVKSKVDDIFDQLDEAAVTGTSPEAPKDYSELSNIKEVVTDGIQEKVQAEAPIGEFNNQLAIPSNSDIIPDMTTRKGTANIPPETNPKAVGGIDIPTESVVRNNNGDPMPVYHGSSYTFDKLSAENSLGVDNLVGYGIYTTESPKIAAGYMTKGNGNNPSLRQVYLDIRNPLDFDKSPKTEFKEEFMDRAIGEGWDINEEMYNSILKKKYSSMRDFLEEFGFYKEEMADESITAIIEDMGHDGITHIGGEGKNTHRVWVAFNDDQIIYPEKEIIPPDLLPNQSRPSKEGGRLFAPAPENTLASLTTPNNKIESPITDNLDNLIPQVKGGMVGELPKYAEGSAINLERLNTTDDIKHFINKMAGDIESKIGKRKITWEESRLRAEELGWNVKELKKEWDSGNHKFGAAEIEAARQINLNTISDLHEAIRNIPYDQTKLTPEIRAKVLDAMDAVRVTSQMSSEAGRALNIHKKILSNDPAFREQSEINRVLKVLQGKGTKRTDDLIDKLRDIDFSNPAEVNRFIYNITKTKWQKLSDAAYEIWMNGLLSNPLSHIRNTVGNALTLAYTYPERLTAAGIEAISAKATGRTREIRLGEAKQDIFSISKGLRDGLRRFADVLEKGERNTKFDYPPSVFPNRVQKYLPTRALTAEDAFFKGVIENQELNRLAYRKAAKEGLSGIKAQERITEILSNPPEEMLEAAAKRSQYLTYQKELGEVGRLIMRARDIVPGLKYFIPFVKTPTNIAKFALERTPLNFPLLIYKASKGELKGAALSDELAKPIMGSILGYSIYQLAEDGYVTGGAPRQRSERDELLSIGWQPYSIKIGNKYYGFGGLEPLGSILGIAADFNAIKKNMSEDEKYNVAAGIYGAISQNIKDKTFMQGLSNIINATSDPGRYGKNVFKQFAGSVVPGASAGLARATDDYIRDTRSILDTIKSRIPGVSHTVPVKLDVWGEPIRRTGSAATRLLSPMPVSEVKGSAIERELAKLSIDVGYPARKITRKGKTTELTDQQYAELLKNSGQKAKRYLNYLIEQGGFDDLPDDRKSKIIKTVVDKYREQERRKIIGF